MGRRGGLCATVSRANAKKAGVSALGRRGVAVLFQS